MKRKQLFAAIVVSSMLLSCTNSLTGTEDLIDVDPAEVAITFDPSVNGVTRVISDLFEVGDQITVNAYDGGSIFESDVQYIYNGDLFASEDPIFFEDDSQYLSFRAIYPAVDSFADALTFTANSDQSSGDNFEMSDLLYAYVSKTNDECPTLEFNHIMTSVVVDIITPNMGDGVLTLYGATKVVFDFANDDYSVSSSATSVIAASNGSDSFKAILAPQSISTGTLMATYEIDGDIYEWTLDRNYDFEIGCRYSFEWNLIEGLVSFKSYINGWDDVYDGDDVLDSDDDVSSDFAIYFDIPEAISVSNMGGEYLFSFETSASLAEINSAASWLQILDVTLTNKVDDIYYYDILFDCEANTSTSWRGSDLELLFYTDWGEIYSYVIEVMQESASDSDSSYTDYEPIFELENYAFSCTAESSTNQIKFISNLFNTSVTTDSDWCFVSVDVQSYDEESECFTYLLSFTVDANTQDSERECKIFFSGTGESGTIEYGYSVIVVQEGASDIK